MRERHTGKSRRELNKEDKLERIKEAAFHLFSTRGYDDTTTREIAARAGVGMGTVFVYAETKRDLLFLIVNDDLEACVDVARHVRNAGLSLYDTLIAILRIHYEYFHRTPTVSRAALREMYFYQTGKQSERFIRRRDSLGQLLEDLVASAMEARLIHTVETAGCVAATIFAVYQVHVRRWLAEETTSIDAALEDLGRQIQVVMNGLSPHPDVFRSEQSLARP
ncbi:TetR/AcrR family transcriptional regulator [Muricoccus vinaceus]|uniref:TetR/AcrR family transcriptional regulator n=1 Tax=Muricoccus vinaceus TaxID=424704 RepID=A0ABV6INI0_9PROT